MKLNTTRVDVWAAEIEDRPGALARTLRTISESGANLECVLARRDTEKAGKGSIFFTPLVGLEQIQNATEMGLHRTEHLATLKIEGEDRPGLGAELTRAISEVGVNLHGMTAATVGHKFVCFASFDSVADLEKAETAVHTLESRPMKKWREILHRKQREDAATHA